MSGEAGCSAAGETSSTTPGSRRERGHTEESEALTRAERVRALGDVSPVALEALIQALDDPDALVRGSAVIALIDEDPERVLAALQDHRQERESSALGRSPYPGPRILEYELIARASMSQRLDSTRTSLCAAALAEPDALVRSRAFASCVRAGVPDAQWLESATRDPAWAARARLAEALSSLAAFDPAALEALRRLADDDHTTVRLAARRALQ